MSDRLQIRLDPTDGPWEFKVLNTPGGTKLVMELNILLKCIAASYNSGLLQSILADPFKLENAVLAILLL